MLSVISKKNLNSNLIKRSIQTLSINGYSEQIYERSDFPLKKSQKILEKEKISVLGYGPQGRGQSLNLRDNGFDVIIGVRKNGDSWNKALKDNWKPNINMFPIDEAVSKSTTIQYLLSDAAQISNWDCVKSNLKENNTLYFSHGFGIVFDYQTNIKPPSNVDVVLVAPKGPGGLVREKFQKGEGINSSYAIHQNYSGQAKEKTLALAFGIGSLNVFETTFEKEVYSDLTGERCVLMGLIQGAFKAQYNVLRKNGHSPSEAFNETVEEALVSLYPLVNEKGMDWMFENCSTTAQRGALDWAPYFEKLIEPGIEKCYHSVLEGKESQRSINSNQDEKYREKLNRELELIKQQEIWKVGKFLRSLR
jgi:ketol-acid reductoisomerase